MLLAIRWIPSIDLVDHSSPGDLSTLAGGRLTEDGAVKPGHLLTEQYQICTTGLGRDLNLTRRLEVVHEEPGIGDAWRSDQCAVIAKNHSRLVAEIIL